MKEFVAGFAAAVALCSSAWVLRRSLGAKGALKRERQVREERFDSLCRSLELSGENSERRAMAAICRGEQLAFEHVEPKLLRFLGFVGDARMPSTAYDLLPPSMEPHHRLWVAKAIRDKVLPERLGHPLRSVDVRHASGHYMRMDLIIERVPDASEPVFQLVFASVDPSAIYQLQTLSTGEQVPALRDGACGTDTPSEKMKCARARTHACKHARTNASTHTRTHDRIKKTK